MSDSESETEAEGRSDLESGADADDEVRIFHDPRKSRALSDAVLAGISKAKGEDLTKAECELFDDIDPAALDDLFRGGGGTSVMFNTSDVGVRLTARGGVEIRVAALTG